MRLHEALPALLAQLEADGLDPRRLEPQAAWTAFKRFLTEPVEGALDAACIQIDSFADQDGHVRDYLFCVRQFSDFYAEAGEIEEEPLRRVVVELTYEPEGVVADERVEIWTQDAASREAFLAEVEGSPAFQRAMARPPSGSDVYDQEL
ncbi:MAG: hypothetical protein ACREMH_04640 [Gemmatimonadales bacterium]